MEDFTFYSYFTAAIAYLFLLLMTVYNIKKSSFALPFAGTVFFSLLWSSQIASSVFSNELAIADVLPLETLRNSAWFGFLLVLISNQRLGTNYGLFFSSKRVFYSGILILFALSQEYFKDFGYQLNSLLGVDLRLISHVLCAIIGLVLIEQLYRNAGREQRWGIKFFCLALGAIFTIDFFIYSKSLLFSKLDTPLWNSRGLLNALTVPLMAIALSRSNINTSTFQAPRKAVFHTTVLLGTGVYLLLMSLAGFYIRDYGGNWGELAQIIFIFLALLLLIILFVSGKIRAIAKVYFGKHFFNYRYDYRDEWIKLSKAIAQLNSFSALSVFTINTLSDLIDSSGGGLWLKNQQGDFYLTQDQNLGFSAPQYISADDSLICFLSKKQWVIDFIEFNNDPDMYDDVNLSYWLAEDYKVWLIVPLFQQNELLAFVVLSQARVPRQLNWEDHDLLKTAGLQLANALALSHASDELARSRQFEAYNRLSAYIVHDLKNLVAQISLIVKNAHKHKHNPEFIDDSIATLENVVHKMQHLVDQFKKGQLNDQPSIINLVDIINDVALQQAANTPVAEVINLLLHCEVYGEQQKMTAILGHLVQNAQEATADEGSVKIQLEQEPGLAIIKIIDTGSGMDEKFIAERLFKPFDTTKGNAGMGIGVYEAQDYITKHSGAISVTSCLGVGTVFTVKLPLADKKTDI
jgi:putative PEP-CTERM system histidine kinase